MINLNEYMIEAVSSGKHSLYIDKTLDGMRKWLEYVGVKCRDRFVMSVRPNDKEFIVIDRNDEGEKSILVKARIGKKLYNVRLDFDSRNHLNNIEIFDKSVSLMGELVAYGRTENEIESTLRYLEDLLDY